MIICPDCGGRGCSIVFVNTGLDSSNHYSEMRECDRCMGARYVGQNVIDSIEKGKELRKKRIAQGLTLREAAKAEGVTVSMISRREVGR